jgi:hypothetical protein
LANEARANEPGRARNQYQCLSPNFGSSWTNAAGIQSSPGRILRVYVLFYRKKFAIFRWKKTLSFALITPATAGQAHFVQSLP